MDIAVVVQRQIRLHPRRRDVHRQPGDRRARRARDRGRPSGSARPSSRAPSRPTATWSRRRTLAIRRREVHHKELAIEYDPDGAAPCTRALSEQERCAPVLDDEEVLAVAELGRADRDSTTARPQDTEWAFDPDGTLWMLQSRPITDARAPSDGQLGDGRRLATERQRRRPCCCAGWAARPAARAAPARILALARGRRRSERRRRARHAHDRRRTGSPLHAPCRGHRHRLRRHDLPRRDRLARARHPLRRRYRRGDAGAARRRGRSRSTRRAEWCSRAPLPRGRRGRAGRSCTRRRARSGPITATQLLVNLSEPSQVDAGEGPAGRRRGTAARRADGARGARWRSPARCCSRRGAARSSSQRMADALSTFADGFAPRPVTYRTIDFRTNEFVGLRGGDRFEPDEANPMIGYRGALRYTREPDVFRLELQALARVWDDGPHNLHLMLPFVRTTRELRRCRELIAESGLLDRAGFELWVMAEVPSVLFNLERLRGARHPRHLDRLQRPHAAAARRRPRQRGARGDLRRARPGGHRLPAAADPRARAGSGFAPRSAGRRPRCTRSTPTCSSSRDRRDLGEHRRDRPRAGADRRR